MNRIGIDQTEKTTPVGDDRIIQTDSANSNATVWSKLTNLATAIFGLKTTTNLTEGDNLYYTDARVNTNIASKTTDDIDEGTTNKYTTSTSVNTAGAVMNTDTTTASMGFVIDEDDMDSDSDTKVPTQQSVKAYVDDVAGSNTTYVTTVTAAVATTPFTQVKTHGLGRIPTKFEFMGTQNSVTDGTTGGYFEGGTYASYHTQVGVFTDCIGALTDTAANYNKMTITNITTTQYTITYTVVGSPGTGKSINGVIKAS